MTNYDRIAETPEALGAFLASLPIANAPWDDEFHKQFCADCHYLGCDSCPHEQFRNNPLWWLKRETQKDYEAEWKVVPGPGGWMVGWFICGKCGGRSDTDEEICPHCKAKMKKIKWG